MSAHYKPKNYVVVLHFIASLKLGGAESALVNYLNHARNDVGYTHHIAYIHDGPNRLKIEQLGFSVSQIRGVVHTYDPVIIYRLYKLIQKIKPDVIHTSLWSANVIGRIVGKLCSIPVVSDLHGLPRHEGALRNWVERNTMQWSDRIVAVADVVKTDYEHTILGARSTHPGKLVVIKNGIDYDKIMRTINARPSSRAELGLAADDFVVGAVGRLEPIKSYDILLKAVSQAIHHGAKNIKLCLVGDGSQMGMLKTLAHSLRIESLVLFLGYKSDAYHLYPLFDCFALSSQSEGLSIALLEAMACGVPIITTHDGIVHDAVSDGINGLLVPPNDVNAYAHALITLRDSPKMRTHMAYANRSLIKSHFSLDSVVQQYHALYRSVSQ